MANDEVAGLLVQLETARETGDGALVQALEVLLAKAIAARSDAEIPPSAEYDDDDVVDPLPKASAFDAATCAKVDVALAKAAKLDSVIGGAGMALDTERKDADGPSTGKYTSRISNNDGLILASVLYEGRVVTGFSGKSYSNADRATAAITKFLADLDKPLP